MMLLALSAVAAVMIVLGLPVQGWAQAGVTLTGVAEDETGAGIPDVSITLISMTAGDPRETVSDTAGRFSFPHVAPGPHVLRARARGGELVDLPVTVWTVPPASVTITLKDESSLAASAVVPLEGAEITGDLAGPPGVKQAAAGSEPAVPPDTSAAAQVPAGPDTDGAETESRPVADTAPEAQTPPLPGGQGVPPQPQPGEAASLRLWSVALTVANSYDSNIDHDLQSVNAYGLAYGTWMHYQSSRDRPLFQVEYDITRYSVPGAGRWTRLSHFLRTVVERRLHRRLYVDVVGDFVASGTSEDRELVNQYLVRPRVEYRLPRGHRVRFYAAHRLKRYANTAVRDATNRYVGLELQRRFETGDRWQIGYRYEENRAAGLRYHYRRLTYETEYITVLTPRDAVALNVVYRSQRYPHRFAELDDVDVPRHNQRWVPSLWFAHRIMPRVEARLEYVLDTQSSNDLDEPYTAHNFGFSLRYTW